MSFLNPAPVPNTQLIGSQSQYIDSINNLGVAVTPCRASCSNAIQNGALGCSPKVNIALSSADNAIRQAVQTPNGEVGNTILDAAITKANTHCN